MLGSAQLGPIIPHSIIVRCQLPMAIAVILISVPKPLLGTHYECTLFIA